MFGPLHEVTRPIANVAQNHSRKGPRFPPIWKQDQTMRTRHSPYNKPCGQISVPSPSPRRFGARHVLTNPRPGFAPPAGLRN